MRQVIGGAASVRGGTGERIERLSREVSRDCVVLQAVLMLARPRAQVRINTTAGGSDTILRELATRKLRARL